MWSLLTARNMHICSQYAPNIYQKIVNGYIRKHTSLLWAIDLNAFILYYTFYSELFPNLRVKIQSSIISDKERAKLILDTITLLSLQRKKWDDEIIASLGI